MRIMHLNSELFLGGGLERIIVDLMIKNNKTPSYLCVINDRWSKEYIEMLNKDSLLLCNRREGTRNPIINLRTIYKTCRFMTKNNVDIIHCHDTFSLKFAYLLKKMMKVKVVFTVHDTKIYNENLNKYPVDKYIAISKAVYKTVSKYVPEEKIKLIYNGVNLEKFGSSIELSNKNKDVLNIACVARIVPEKKGQDILIKSLNILRNQYGYTDFNCFFAGAATDQKQIDQLNDLILQYHLEKNVKFLGNIENIERVYADTDIFVLPSRYEGFGLVVVEALAAGCTVIVSKLEGPLEIVKENEEYGLCFKKEDYKELAEKLYRLVSDEDYRKQYEKNNKTTEYLEREYSLENMIKRYNEAYRELYINI
ncbi:glycosyltransferase family 4 protein [Bacillus cereus group sp. BfR-BA-01380]|uniref:glycosyltransferase family 4 protein n=1 Tax=Bacillus cereus group sp. BfR-BA-01380 TaxID=2920324 RepID=UPI001F572DF0|nr:glycosyltransferase family 4 protein [Bacillus cereus group sp. BfR-BA-01380]